MPQGADYLRHLLFSNPIDLLLIEFQTRFGYNVIQPFLETLYSLESPILDAL